MRTRNYRRSPEGRSLTLPLAQSDSKYIEPDLALQFTSPTEGQNFLRVPPSHDVVFLSRNPDQDANLDPGP